MESNKPNTNIFRRFFSRLYSHIYPESAGPFQECGVIIPLKVHKNEAARTFIGNESAAVTVDIVVLTAGLMGLAISVLITTGDSIVAQSDKVALCMKKNRVLLNANVDYDKRLKRAARKCSKL